MSGNLLSDVTVQGSSTPLLLSVPEIKCIKTTVKATSGESVSYVGAKDKYMLSCLLTQMARFDDIVQWKFNEKRMSTPASKKLTVEAGNVAW